MHMHLETLTADAALRQARAQRPPAPQPQGARHDAAAMLAAARRIVATTRVAFADAAHAPSPRR